MEYFQAHHRLRVRDVSGRLAGLEDEGTSTCPFLFVPWPGFPTRPFPEGLAGPAHLALLLPRTAAPSGQLPRAELSVRERPAPSLERENLAGPVPPTLTFADLEQVSAPSRPPVGVCRTKQTLGGKQLLRIDTLLQIAGRATFAQAGATARIWQAGTERLRCLLWPGPPAGAGAPKKEELPTPDPNNCSKWVLESRAPGH